jgi:hypothetical protein
LPFSPRGSPCTGTSCIGRRLPFPSWAWPCTSAPCAGCRSRGSASTPSSWCRRACSSSSWRLASASLSSRARRWSSASRWRGASSDEELLDAVATQTLHSRVGVMTSRGPCPPSRHTPRGYAGRAEAINIGRHRVDREARRPWGYIAVYRSMNSLQPSGPSLLAWKGEVGEVIGGEPKTLLHWVWPQHADDDVTREASDESLTHRSPCEDIGARRPAEGTAGNGLHRPGVDEAERAEVQCGPGSHRDPAPIHPIC